MADKDFKSLSIPINGKLITAIDAALIGQDCQSRKNIRYDGRGVGGQTKINTTALTSYPVIKAGYHFEKAQPAESHVLVQAHNSGGTESKVFENTTAIPSAGDFTATALHTDTAGSTTGVFSNAPDGSVVYCNGKDTMIWGGNEARCAAFINIDPAGTFERDFTGVITNTLTDSLNVATLKKVTATTTVYVGSIRPLKGVKAYVSVANDATCALTDVHYYGASGWTSCTSVVDNTAVAGKALAATGTITFATTSGLAQPYFISNRLLYWYKFTWASNLNEATAIYYFTVDAPFQTMRDLWDGQYRTTLSFIKFTTTTAFNDYTVNTSQDTYAASNSATYSDLSSLTSATGAIYMGFLERLTGIYVSMADGYGNTTASTTLTVKYWTGSAWASVSNQSDKTSASSISFAKTGVVSWTPPAENLEFKRNMNDGLNLYYYQFTFNQNFSAGVRSPFVGGITTQKQVRGYSFPLFAENRLWLCCNKDDKKNSVRCLGVNSTSIFNGDDSMEFVFGDEKAIVAATSVYGKLGTEMYNIKLFFKPHEVWAITGSSIEYYKQDQVLRHDGCTAAATVNSTTMEFEGTSKPIVMWQGAEGIYMFDGSSVSSIHDDIANLFDKKSSDKLNTSMISASSAYIDTEKYEYHWMCATGSATSLNREFVYDIRLARWFEIDRTTGKYLQCGFKVADTNGNVYYYGATTSGFLYRLEYGTTFDSANMTFTLHTGDFELVPEAMTQIERIHPEVVAKTNTTNSITLTYYSDTLTTGVDSTIAVSHTGYRVADNRMSKNLAPARRHSIKLVMITNNETWGVEFISIHGSFKVVRLER